jgi:hypothetical protein
MAAVIVTTASVGLLARYIAVCRDAYPVECGQMLAALDFLSCSLEPHRLRESVAVRRVPGAGEQMGSSALAHGTGAGLEQLAADATPTCARVDDQLDDAEMSVVPVEQDDVQYADSLTVRFARQRGAWPVAIPTVGQVRPHHGAGHLSLVRSVDDPRGLND